MADQEFEQKKRECWEEFKNATFYGNIPYSTYSALGFAFDRAYALGKQEKDADTVISGWVARDMDGEIYLYENEPKRGSDEWHGVLHPKFDFQNVRWSNDPIEVEIIIKRKKGSKCLPDEGGKLPANCQQVKSEPQAPDYFRDPAKKADLSPKEADLLISRTLRDFDFIKVLKCMESLGWKWIIGEDRHIPSVGELYQKAEELLKSAVEKQCSIFSGGLQAHFDGNEVTLLFAVADSGYTLEELEFEKGDSITIEQ